MPSRAFERTGSQVVVTGRSRSGGEEAARDVRELSGNDSIGLLLADESTRAGVEFLADQSCQGHGALAVLINNTGPGCESA